MKNQEPQYLNVQQSALFLGVNANTIRRWAYNKKLKGVKVGTRGDWRFTKEELSKLIQVEQEKFSKIKSFLNKYTEEIQRLSTEKHELLITKSTMRRDFRKHRAEHVEVIEKLANNLQDVENGRKIFNTLGENLAKKAIEDGLSLEEAVDGISFMKQAVWEKLHDEGLLNELTTQDFYHLSTIISIYTDILASKVAFSFHSRYKAERETDKQKLYNLFHQAPIPMAILMGPDHVYELSNPYTNQVLKVENPIGKSIKELFPDNKEILELLNTTYQTGKPFTASEYPIKIDVPGKGQQTIYVNATYQPLRDENNSIIGIMTTGVDVTEQVLARQKLKYQATLTEQIHDAVIGTDIEFTITSWNKGAEKLYGWTAQEAIGKPTREMVQTKHINITAKEWRDQLIAKGYWQGEVAQKKKDGTALSVLSSIAYVKDDEGKPIGAVAVNRDMSDRKQTEEALHKSQFRYNKLFNSNTIGIFAPRFDGSIYEANDIFLKMLGYEKEDLKQGRIRWDKMTPQEYRKTDEEKIQELVNTGQATPWEKEYIRKDGSRIPVLLGVVMLDDITKEGLAFAIDITDRKVLEQQKDDFLGVASHELKTPVTSIKAYTQVMQTRFKKRGDQESVEFLEKMNTQLNKLTSLIGDLLDVTKIQAGKLELQPDYFDFNELVIEIVNELQLISTKHTIETNLAKTKTVYGDRERIGQVITNLLSNAIKYSPKANKIVVTSEVKTKEVILSVQDFGVGIPKEKKDMVFERFYRVDGNKTGTFPGLGLGLFISSELIRRHHGRISLESDEGKGSIFTITLPLKPKSK